MEIVPSIKCEKYLLILNLMPETHLLKLGQQKRSCVMLEKHIVEHLMAD